MSRLHGEFFPPFGATARVLMTLDSVLCSEMAVKQIDEPFVLPSDDKEDWSL